MEVNPNYPFVLRTTENPPSQLLAVADQFCTGVTNLVIRGGYSAMTGSLILNAKAAEIRHSLGLPSQGVAYPTPDDIPEFLTGASLAFFGAQLFDAVQLAEEWGIFDRLRTRSRALSKALKLDSKSPEAPAVLEARRVFQEVKKSFIESPTDPKQVTDLWQSFLRWRVLEVKTGEKNRYQRDKVPAIPVVEACNWTKEELAAQNKLGRMMVYKPPGWTYEQLGRVFPELGFDGTAHMFMEDLKVVDRYPQSGWVSMEGSIRAPYRKTDKEDLYYAFVPIDDIYRTGNETLDSNRRDSVLNHPTRRALRKNLAEGQEVRGATLVGYVLASRMREELTGYALDTPKRGLSASRLWGSTVLREGKPHMNLCLQVSPGIDGKLIIAGERWLLLRSNWIGLRSERVKI